MEQPRIKLKELSENSNRNGEGNGSELEGKPGESNNFGARIKSVSTRNAGIVERLIQLQSVYSWSYETYTRTISQEHTTQGLVGKTSRQEEGEMRNMETTLPRASALMKTS